MGSKQFAASFGFVVIVTLGTVWRAPAVPAAQAPAARWWSHIEFLASDEMQGRETGSPQHRKAAQYVAEHFAKAGLRTTVGGGAPGRPDAFLQTVPFSSSKIVEQKSTLALVRNGAVDPVVLGDEATINMRIVPAAHVEAPIVFVGQDLAYTDGKAYVVVGKRASDNALLVAFDAADAPGLFQTEVRVHSLQWNTAPLTGPRRLEGRVRYRDPRVAIEFIPEGGGTALVRFDEPQRGLASGQILALYDGERLLGGGVYV